MLHRILEAHGGALPDDVLPLFCNTGREMPATLDFVRDMETHWGVHITWLEYRHEPGRHFFEVVNHNSASRAGEPLAACFEAKSSLPNPVQRFCTVETKIRTIKRYVVATYGWKHWASCVGLRADESRRVIKALTKQLDRWHNTCPLYDAGITQDHIFEFWAEQDFDLALNGKWEGNCDGCFLKSRGNISRMAKDYPDRIQWWADQEAKKQGVGAGGKFRNDREPYSEILGLTHDQGVLSFLHDSDLSCVDSMCGV
jgi:3'-phosphoadenosine 5'-phosphosulfate sulfotransferase (PAPS reductase)/FAD synthetase